MLLEELVRICGYAQQEPKWIGHVHLICEEIESHLAGPLTIGTIPGVAEAVLGNIAKFRLNNIAELARLIEQVKIFQQLNNSYLENLLNSGRALAFNGNKKEDLSKVMGGLATHVQHSGAGEESIAKINDDFCTRSPDDVFEQLCDDVKSKTRTYSCFIAISAERSVASSLFAGLEFQEVGASAFELSDVVKEWIGIRKEGITVRLVVSAASRLKAASQALSEISKLIQLHALYANSVAVGASAKVLVEEEGQYEVVEVTPSRHFGLEPRRKAEELSRDRYLMLKTRLRGRLANLLESHSLAVSANDARSAVFHLWTALETLASGLGSEGIGDRVANVVAPIVAWRRVDKIVTYLAFSAHQLRGHAGLKYDLSLFPRSDGRSIHKFDILKCVTGKFKNPEIMAAFDLFGQSPLLNFRLHRTWHECSSPVELRSTLQKSQKKIKWQVMRFYRARNLLVHYGEVDHLALRLLENAQYYLSTCVGRVLNDLQANESWELNTSLEFQRHRFESLLRRLDERPKEVSANELLVHAAPADATHVIWPDFDKKKKKSGHQNLETGDALSVTASE
ncbi:hypothetical protein AB4Y42_37325 [Paraburkholderia sp. EG286B]|uniref:hypothetical protein n=1 Tax=Paraburkholderia sp. EG286B TaxID=3237011 RepID=UPI0034D29397